jgi:hypothetical protein
LKKRASVNPSKSRLGRRDVCSFVLAGAALCPFVIVSLPNDLQMFRLRDDIQEQGQKSCEREEWKENTDPRK